MPHNVIMTYTSLLTVSQLDQTVPRIGVGQSIDAQTQQYDPHATNWKDVLAVTGDNQIEPTYEGDPLETFEITFQGIPYVTETRGTLTVMGYWHWYELDKSTPPGTVFNLDARNIVGIEQQMNVTRVQGDSRMLTSWQSCYYQATLRLQKVN